ncbi:MAG: DUF6544 family protein [Dermatophilaceae bacterium]
MGRQVVKWTVVGVLGIHGAVHLVGAARVFGWAEVAQLSSPTSVTGGAGWLAAGVLVFATAGMVAVGAPRWWWAVAATAAAASQAMVFTAWDDAGAGTAVNGVLALVAVYGLFTTGPPSAQARWRTAARHALADLPGTSPAVTEDDVARLPAPLAHYVRRSGAVGRPTVTASTADLHGRIRGGPDQPWMPYRAVQVNTFGVRPQRFFLMQARRRGIPVEVLHIYDHEGARMRAALLSVATVAEASGPRMDRAETVTLLNDLVVLAPGAIPSAPVRWEAVDDRHVRGRMTVGAVTVAATLVFNAVHDLVDFVSQDRLRALDGGAAFVRQPWSTPLSGYAFTGPGGRRVATYGEGRWQAPPPEGEHTYVEVVVDAVRYLPRSRPGGTDPLPVPPEPGVCQCALTGNDPTASAERPHSGQPFG